MDAAAVTSYVLYLGIARIKCPLVMARLRIVTTYSPRLQKTSPLLLQHQQHVVRTARKPPHCAQINPERRVVAYSPIYLLPSINPSCPAIRARSIEHVGVAPVRRG